MIDLPLAGPSTDTAEHTVSSGTGCWARSVHGVNMEIPSHCCGSPEVSDLGLCQGHLDGLRENGQTHAARVVRL